MEKKKYIIGLDLGINNVGYSVIDEESKKILKKGVRLFSQANEAEDRRIARNTRRRLKRRENRVNETLKLFKGIGFPAEITIEPELLSKRVKGLKEKLEPQEIVNIICYFMMHRGYIPFGDEERTLVELNGLLPCEYYMKKWQEIGKYRALEEVVNHQDLKKEMQVFLENQIKYYPELSKIVGNEEKGLLWIFSRKRKFWEGPGSAESFSEYGRFKNEEDVLEYQELKKEGKEKYLFEELIGHCKIYVNEKCAPKANYYAEEFNLINDFLNIRVINRENILKESYVNQDTSKAYHLTTDAIEAIIEYCKNFTGKSLSYNKVLKDVLGLTKEDIAGYRIDKDGKPLFSLLNAYRSIKKIYEENNLDSSWLINDLENYNRLINILAVAPGKVEIAKMLENIHEFTQEELDVIGKIQEKLKKDRFLDYHALSEKALTRAIKDMKATCLNFMQVSKKFDYEKEAREYYLKNYGTGEGNLLMTSKFVDEIVASPQVKKTLRQAIRIINAIIEEQGSYPSVIAIESAKEMNGAEKRKEIERVQKNQEKYRKDAKRFLEKTVSDDKVKENMIERVMLFEETNGHCPYCGKGININDVINNSVEVEHIIPISQSADDSFENKTLACRECNSKKKNKIPFSYMSSIEFEEFTKRILQLNISEKKKQNFLTTDDPNKYQTRFFNRNLRDTAYATKELVTQIQLFNEYLKANLKGENIEIKTLSTPGQLTHKVRRWWDLDKNRDIGKFHHAVDASIVAGIATTPIGKRIVEAQNNSQFWIKEKDKVKEFPELLEKFTMYDMKEEISKIQSDEDILISMQVNKEANRSIANSNIYSYVKKEDEYYRIDQISDIYAPDLFRNNESLLNELFDETKTTKTLLCQEKDPKLFQYLKDIYYKYQDGKTNPFRNYCEELMGDETKKFNERTDGIFTPSKNGKGVLVKKLRYMQRATDPFILNKKSINKKENTYIGLDSIAIYCTKLYWDKDEKKILFFPIYLPVLKFDKKKGYAQNPKINDQHPLYQLYYNKVLKGKRVEHIVDLYNGNFVKIEKPNGNILEDYVSYYDKTNNNVVCKLGKKIASKDKFTLYDVDILGNKKKRLTWPKE